MAVYKIIVTGSFNSGKTTFVKCISDIKPITTDKPVSEDNLKSIKHLTTVAMDFGILNIDKDLVLHIYATPGQERFDVVYSSLVKNALALIVLGDATNRKSLENMGVYYRKFLALKKLPAVFALTKTDLSNVMPEDEIESIMSNTPSDIPILRINTNNKKDVKDAVLTALEQLM